MPYIGPVAGFTIAATLWNITSGVGAIVRATRSTHTSSAVRDLPFGNGFAIRSAVSLLL